MTTPGEVPSLRTWQERGRFIEIFGLRIFVLETCPNHELPPLLMLHGFPTSCHDFHAVLPELSRRFNVVLFDYPGFGLSAKPPSYSYSLFEQAEVAIGVWRALGLTHGHLVAHDYGTSVATELVARRLRGLLPVELDSLTLCNGSVHLELARLTVSQRLLRDPRIGPLFSQLAGRRFFGAKMRKLFARPEALSEANIDVMWQALNHGDGRRRLSAVSQYLAERSRFRMRWIGALLKLDLPTHVLWGREDPVAVPAIAEQLHREISGSTLTWLEGVGHYPQLEAPQRWCAGLLRGEGF